jgi:hypothetical protein
VNISKKVSGRIAKEIPGFQKVLKKAKSRDVSESDTVTIVADIVADVFGFDKYAEITSEQAIRGTYCDLAVTLDGKPKYLIEIKAIGLDLKDNHLRQAVGYGANLGIPWVVLTNGIDWEIHRIKFERPLSHEQVLAFDFTALNPRRQDDRERAYLLCKEGIATAAMEEFHDYVQSVNRFMIGAASLTDPVTGAIRRELRRVSPGLKVTNEEIENILVSEVFKRDLVEGESFESAKRKVKKAAKQTKPRRTLVPIASS